MISKQFLGTDMCTSLFSLTWPLLILIHEYIMYKEIAMAPAHISYGRSCWKPHVRLLPCMIYRSSCSLQQSTVTTETVDLHATRWPFRVLHTGMQSICITSIWNIHAMILGHIEGPQPKRSCRECCRLRNMSKVCFQTCRIEPPHFGNLRCYCHSKDSHQVTANTTPIS